MAEGKPVRPDSFDADKWAKWYRTPPKTHHLVYWKDHSLRSVQFDQSQDISTRHEQQFGEGVIPTEAVVGDYMWHLTHQRFSKFNIN